MAKKTHAGFLPIDVGKMAPEPRGIDCLCNAETSRYIEIFLPNLITRGRKYKGDSDRLRQTHLLTLPINCVGTLRKGIDKTVGNTAENRTDQLGQGFTGKRVMKCEYDLASAV